MAQAKRKKQIKPDRLLHMHYRLREGGVILLSFLALFLFLALVTYQQTDPGWSKTGSTEQVLNLGGHTGAWFADIFFYLFGYLAYLFPLMIAGLAAGLIKQRQVEGPTAHLLLFHGLGFLGTLLTSCALTQLYVGQF